MSFLSLILHESMSNFTLRNISECEQNFKLVAFPRNFHFSRVESQVGTLIAFYFFNSFQINVIFVFSCFGICINQLKISKIKNPNR